MKYRHEPALHLAQHDHVARHCAVQRYATFGATTKGCTGVAAEGESVRCALSGSNASTNRAPRVVRPVQQETPTSRSLALFAGLSGEARGSPQ
jgi:hypothetical protein